MIDIQHLVYGLGAIVVVGVVAALTMHLWHRYQAQSIVAAEQQIKVVISQKAAVAALAVESSAAQAEEEELTQSGVIAINVLLGRLIDNGDYTNAKLWAENALRSNSNQVSVAIKLVEAHHCAGDRREFFSSLSEFVLPQRDNIDAQTWAHLETMLADFAPGAESRSQQANA